MNNNTSNNKNSSQNKNSHRSHAPEQSAGKSASVGYFSKEQKETLKLIGILSVGVLILLILSIVLMNSLKAPVSNEPKYIDIDNVNGMNLHQVKTILDKADIAYEIIPTKSLTVNRVEKIDYVGVQLVDTGRLRVRIGTTVKLYANEVSQDKVIYLTFDDGPTRDNTNEILDTLDTYGIKATFFVQGTNVDRYPDRMYTTAKRGHLIGCHSYSHDLPSIYSSIDAFLAEVDQYEKALAEALEGEQYMPTCKVLRFPGGTTTNSRLTVSEALEYIAAVRQKGYKVYDWTSLTGDAEGYQEADDFIRYMSETLESSKNKNLPLIVLLHDKWSTNEALSEILDYLIAEGYYFDTIDNCPEYTVAEQ